MELEIRIALALGMLGVACISDIKNRQISDVVWIVFGVTAAILILFSTDITDDLIKIGISLIIAPISIIIWRLGLFGGADAFALIVLAALVPNITLSDGMVTPFTTLSNAVVLSIIPVLVNATRNFTLLAKGQDIFAGFNETKPKKILAMFIGYRAKNPRFGFCMESYEDNHKKIIFTLHHSEYAEFCTKKDTWITPGIPYMMFITSGFVVQLLYGDIIFRF